MISKTGAKKFLDFVNANRLINCIDTALQKSANDLNVYYITPHLIFSECFRRDVQEQKLDTDIQHNFQSLTMTIEDKIQIELDFFKEQGIQVKYLESIETIHLIDNYIGYSTTDISQFRDFCKQNNIRYYTYDEKVIFIIKNEIDVERYYHIFKKGEKYTVIDSLKF